MVVLLVALLFTVFVLLDWVQERRQRASLARVGAELHAHLQESEPKFVAGFALPDGLRFHRGHTWVHWVAPDQAYVGVDDFARRLLGHPDRVKTPPVGAWVEQGEPAVEVERAGREAHLRAPVSGEVLATNPRIRTQPDLLHRDNYGEGWLFKVRSPRLVQQLGNLLDGSLAARWMEDTRERFQHQLTLATGSVVQDGGTTVDDLGSVLDPETWESLVEEFLEAGPSRA